MNSRNRSTPNRNVLPFNLSPARTAHRMLSENDELSPILAAPRTFNTDTSPFFERMDDSSRFHSLHEHASFESLDSDHGKGSIIPRNLFNEPSLTLEPNQTREDRLRQLRIESFNNQLPGAAEFFGEKLVVKTGKY